MQGRGQEDWSLYCFLIWVLVTCVCSWQKSTELDACYASITFTRTHTNKSNKTLCLSFTICKVGHTVEAIMRTAKVSVRAVSPLASCPKFYPPSSKDHEPGPILGLTPGLRLR